MNPSYVEQEVADAYKTCNASHILVHNSLIGTAAKALHLVGFSLDDSKRRVIVLSRRSELPPTYEGWTTVDSLPSAEVSAVPERFDGDDADQVAMMYSSSGEYVRFQLILLPPMEFVGTTGPSKAVQVSHLNVTVSFMQITAAWRYYDSTRDVTLSVMPMSHLFGGNVLGLSSFLQGITVVLLPRFEPRLLLSAVDRYRITVRTRAYISTYNAEPVMYR